MSEITLEQIDRALVLAREQNRSDDEVALLWFRRAEKLGETLTPGHLLYLMGLDEEAAEDIFARLSEHGLIESDETAPPEVSR